MTNRSNVGVDVRLRALVLTFLLVWGSAAALSSPAILVLGDSLSAGYGIPTGKGWVDLLQARLAEAGFPHRVVNASISGDTSRGGLSRLPDALELHAPRLLILELGGNDGLQGLSLDELRDNLRRIIDIARDAGVEHVVLLGMKIPPNYGPYYADGFSALYRSLAQEQDLPLVDFLLEGIATRPGMMQEDGIHPTERAQDRMLENVWQVLEPLLPETSS